jgi:hypothetical protein
MTLWKVRVDCFRKGVAHPMVRRFVVDAEHPVQAFERAAQQAKDSAPYGSSAWTAFEAKRADPVTLPLEV